MERQSVVKIAGTEYEVDPNSYREWVEADVVGARRFNAIVGLSRPGDEPRPEIKVWAIDDWSEGERYKYLNSEPGHPSQQGYEFSTGPVNIRIPGQVSLGFDDNLSFGLGSTPATGPWLDVAGGNAWVAYGAVTKEQTAADTWTTRTSGMNAQTITGPVSGFSGGLFIAGTRSGADGGVRRVTSSGNTQWVAEASRAALVADNRVYYLIDGTTNNKLKRIGLDAAGTGQEAGTFNGTGTSFAASAYQSVSNGSRIYSLVVSSSGENPRLWVLENDVMREVCVFRGLTINQADTVTCLVNGVVFVGGSFVDTDGTRKARVDFFDGTRKGNVFTLAHRSDDTKVTALAEGREDELIIVVGDVSSSVMYGVFRYDLVTQGVSQFMDLSLPQFALSALHLDGVYYISAADQTNTIVRSKTSGSGTYFSPSTLSMPRWDYDLPDTEKLLEEVEITTETLPSGTSIEVQYVLDGTTTITTDASGATIAHSSGARTLITLSDSDTERTFRTLQPKIPLKTSETANTPTLLRVTTRCRPLATKLRYFEFDVLCRDETATNRLTNRQRAGDDIAADLIALRDSTSDRVFQFVPLIKDAPGPHPGPTETTYNVSFAPGEENGIYQSIAPGEGKFRMRLLKVGS